MQACTDAPSPFSTVFKLHTVLPVKPHTVKPFVTIVSALHSIYIFSTIFHHIIPRYDDM